MKFPIKLETLLFHLRDEEWIEELLSISEVYIVGGVVRDNFLGIASKDVDIVVEGMSISNIKSVLVKHGKVDEVGESFKVLKFRPKGFTGEPFDIAIPRKDRKVGTGHKGIETVEAKNIEEDLQRRDFTINSIAFNIKFDPYNNSFDGLIDPFNGLTDLQGGILRATDVNAFVEDPLRILRGIQFAARFDFSIEPKTLMLMRNNSHLISEISGERILDEFEKILMKSGNTQLAFELIKITKLDLALFGQKMDELDADRLDPLSFYYVLGMAGGKDPVDFYLNTLKGNLKMAHALRMLDRIESTSVDDEHELKMVVFSAIQRAPYVEFATILHPKVQEIFSMMNTKRIPKSFKDLQINGNDIRRVMGITGSDIGDAIDTVRGAALMNEFDWKDRKKSLEFLETLK